MIITSRVPCALESTAQTRCQAHVPAYLVMPAVMGNGRLCQKANGTPAPAQTAQLFSTMAPTYYQLMRLGCLVMFDFCSVPTRRPGWHDSCTGSLLRGSESEDEKDSLRVGEV